MRPFFLAALLMAASTVMAHGQTAGSPKPAGSGLVRPLPSAGRWFVSPDVGFDVTLDGDFISTTNQTLTADSSLFGTTASAGTTVRMGQQAFKDVFDTPFHVGVEVGYDFNATNEAAVAFRWLHAGAKTFNAMTLNGTGTFGGQAIGDGMTFKGRFNEYEEYGLDGVYRHYFSVKGQLHPYIGGLAGLKYTPDMKMTLTNAATTISGIPVYDGTWVWDAGLILGFRWDITQAVAFGLEAQLRYSNELDRNLSYSGATAGGASPVSGFNRVGDRFDAPLTMSVTARF